MASNQNAAKQQWKKEHRTQINVAIPPEVAAAFKAKCRANGISMASEISRLMHGQNEKNRPAAKGKAQLDVSNRTRRRKAIKSLIQQLEAILDGESNYLESIPENLTSSMRYEAAEQAVSAMEEALGNLCEAYD